MRTLKDKAMEEAGKYGWGLILIQRSALKRLLEDLFSSRRHLDILEVGCFKAMLYHWLEESFPPDKFSWSYTGVDIVGPFPEWEGKKCMVMNAEALEFPANSFDVVIMIETLEHVVDYVRALREAYRVLRPGGALFVQSVICTDRNALLDETHFHVLHPRTLKRLLEHLGFRGVEYVEADNFAIWGFK